MNVHKLHYQRFHQILKESKSDNSIVTVCFDMQQNQPLPKVIIGEAYYKRQLWVYNLTVMVDSTSQKKEDVGVYTWIENQSTRGSKQVASAVMHFISTYVAVKYKRPTLHLFSDSYPGQNENRSVTSAPNLQTESIIASFVALIQSGQIQIPQPRVETTESKWAELDKLYPRYVC